MEFTYDVLQIAVSKKPKGKAKKYQELETEPSLFPLLEPEPEPTQSTLWETDKCDH